MSHDETRLENIYADIDLAKTNYQAAAEKLSNSRIKSAATLSKKITASMQELNMPPANLTLR